MAHLGGFVGVLQADGFSGYRAIAAGNSVSLAFGWSHVRRRFYELATAGPAPIASEALRRIAELYKIEDDIRGRTREERCAARQGKSRPITDNLAPWLTEQRAIISRKTKLAAGAEHWATIASLVETAKLNAVEPMAYLTGVIARIVNCHPNSQIDELLPWSYRPGKNSRVAPPTGML